MLKVYLKLPPLLARMFSVPLSGNWLILEKEVAENTTISDLMTALTLDSVPFREKVYDPEASRMSNYFHLVINNSLLQCPQALATVLRDRDEIIILPVYTGG